MACGKIFLLDQDGNYTEAEMITDEKIRTALREVNESVSHNENGNKDFYEEWGGKICSNAYCVVIQMGNEICSFAAMYANDMESKQAYITSIAVKPKYQRKNLATYMMNNCVDYALNCGMKTIKLEVKKDNEKAIRLYRNFGFAYWEECSAMSDYYVKIV